MDNLFDFGDYILVPRRKELKLTQDRIAQETGVDQSRIVAYENYGRHPDSIDKVVRFIDCYQLPDSVRNNYFYLCTNLFFTGISIEELSNENIDAFLFDIDKELEKAKQLMRYGVTRMVSNILEQGIIPRLWKKTKEAFRMHDRNLNRIIDRLTKSIHINLDCKSLWLSIKAAIIEMEDGSRTLRTLYGLSKNTNALLVSHLLNSSASYLKNNSSFVVQNSAQAQDIIDDKKIIDPYLMWQNLSVWGVCYAKEKERNKAVETIGKFEEFIDRIEIEPYIYRQFLETSARIDGLTKSESFWKKQEKAINEEFGHEKIPKDPYTANMLIRNEIEAMVLRNDPSINRMINLYNQAKLISGQNFDRLLEEMKEKIENYKKYP